MNISRERQARPRRLGRRRSARSPLFGHGLGRSARLLTGPLLATCAVGFVAVVSILELPSSGGATTTSTGSGEAEGARLGSEASDSPARGAPQLTVAQALALVAAGEVSRPAVAALWPHPRHRSRLRQILHDRDTGWGVRIELLRRFSRENPQVALAAAREVLGERSLEAASALRMACYECLGRLGEAHDLPRLDAPSGESRQMASFRERCRRVLVRREKEEGR